MAAYVVAAAATLSFSLLIPPIGSFRVAFAEDVVALVVFLVVAVVVSSLVANRLEALRKVEQQRGLLLRSVSHDLRSPLTAIQAASTELSTTPATTSPPATSSCGSSATSPSASIAWSRTS